MEHNVERTIMCIRTWIASSCLGNTYNRTNENSSHCARNDAWGLGMFQNFHYHIIIPYPYDIKNLRLRKKFQGGIARTRILKSKNYRYGLEIKILWSILGPMSKSYLMQKNFLLVKNMTCFSKKTRLDCLSLCYRQKSNISLGITKQSQFFC